MARVFRTVALALISIAVLDAILWKLMVSRIDPGLVQYHLSSRPEENRVTAEFSAASLLVWLALILIWAGVLAYRQGFVSRWARAAAATGLFCMQSLVILMFHPLLPLMIVGGNWQSGILRFLCRWDVLADIYGNWGLSRNIHWFIACQIVGTLAVLATAHITVKGAWRSQAARKVAVLLFATAAWLVACYAEPLLFELFIGSSETPHLTFLANVPWYPAGITAPRRDSWEWRSRSQLSSRFSSKSPRPS